MKTIFIPTLFLLLISCATTKSPIFLLNEPHPTVDITNHEKSVLMTDFVPAPLDPKNKDIRYQIKQFEQIDIGVSFDMKWDKNIHLELFRPIPPLPPNYRCKIFFQNNSDNYVKINPSVYLLDSDGLIHNPYDLQAFLTPALKISGKTDFEIDQIFSSRPDEFNFEYDQKLDPLENINNYLKEKRANEERQAMYQARLLYSVMQQKEVEIAQAYIVYISNNYLKNRYEIPPKSKIAAIVYFPNNRNSAPVSLRFKIGNSETTFNSGIFLNNFFSIKLARDQSFIPIYPVKLVDNGGNNKILVYYNRNLDKNTININDILEFRGFNKVWKLEGSSSDRWKNFQNIDQYFE